MVEAGAWPGTDSKLTLLESDSATEKAIMTYLKEVGLVECTTGWQFTLEGKARLLVVKNISPPLKRVLQVRDVDVRAMTVFELLETLHAQGWMHAVAVRRKVKDYSVGDHKVWYTKAKHKSLNRLYLVALLTAPEHKSPVRHFASHEYYQAIIDGKDPPMRSMRGEFSFNDDFMGGGPAQATQRRGPRRKRPRAAVLQESDVEDEDDGSDKSSASGSSIADDGPGGEDSPNSAGESSSSDSSSSGSSNSSSSSSSTGCSNSSRHRRATGHDARRSHMSRGFAFTFGPFKFMPKVKQGQMFAWEVRCMHPQHPATDRGTRCTRTLKIEPDEDMTIRSLKFWCLRGLRCTSKDQHQQLKNNVNPTRLPTMEWLDARAPPADYAAVEGVPTEEDLAFRRGRPKARA